MTLLFPALLSGFAIGMLYGLLAFAMVVLFKATGTVNFAQGMMGALSIFVVWHLMARQGMNTGASLLIGLLFSVLLGAVTYLLVIRPRASVDPANVLVRTIALALVLEAIIDRLWGVGQPFQFPEVLTSGGFMLFGAEISYAILETLAIATLLVAAFAAFFRFTSTGLLTRAMAESPDIARLLGVGDRRLSAVAWGISSLLAAIVAILSAHTLYLSTTMMQGYLLYAFTAAIAFGLTSLPGAVLGGVTMGLISNVLSTFLGPDAATVAVFTVLLIVLLVRPNGLMGTKGIARV